MFLQLIGVFLFATELPKRIDGVEVITEGISNEDAEEHCLKKGKMLATMEDVKNEISNIDLQKPEVDYWAGFRLNDGGTFVIEYKSAEMINPTSPKYPNVLKKLDRNSYGYVTSENKPKVTKDPNQVKYFLCVKEMDAGPPSKKADCENDLDYWEKNKMCFKNFWKKKTWEEAKKTCEDEDATFVIYSEDNNRINFAKKFIDKVSIGRGLWIGLKKINGEWVKSGGLPMTDVEKGVWNVKQSEDGDCGFFSFFDENFVVAKCSLDSYFYCQDGK